MKEANDKKESMKPVSQAVVELDDEALDQVSGGLKRLDSDWKPEITEVCKNLLENTDHDISDIAHLAGFSSQSYLAQSFRKSCGMTAMEYRRSRRE